MFSCFLIASTGFAILSTHTNRLGPGCDWTLTLPRSVAYLHGKSINAAWQKGISINLPFAFNKVLPIPCKDILSRLYSLQQTWHVDVQFQNHLKLRKTNQQLSIILSYHTPCFIVPFLQTKRHMVGLVWFQSFHTTEIW